MSENCTEDVVLVDLATLKNDKYWMNIFGAPKELSWNITGIFIPGISVGTEQLFVRDYPVNTYGDTISTQNAVLEFKITKNIKNYLFFILWMQNEIKMLEEEKDIHIFITNANNEPTSTGFKLKNVKPVDLSGIKFSLEEDTVDLRATVTLVIDAWNVTVEGEEITDITDYVLGNTINCS